MLGGRLSWSVTETESPVTATTGCDPATVTADTAGQTLTCSATSAGGTAGGTVTVERDATAPVVTVTGGPSDGGAYPSTAVPATPTCNATDATSGVDPNGCTVAGYSTAAGPHTLTFSATDVAGNTRSATRAYTVTVDTTPPISTATGAPGAVPSGQPTVTGTVTFTNSGGATVGTLNATCWNSRGAVLTLDATDGGTGVGSLTYAATGAGPIPATTATKLPIKVAVSAAGVTAVAYQATDKAGNVEPTHSQIVLAAPGTLPFACTAPTPTFTVPTHGSVTVTGTATSGGRSAAFTRTVKY